MEELIVQAFDHIPNLRLHVRDGHYDLEGPEGELILKNIWETTIQPGWQINMKMWPQLENFPTRPRMPPMPPGLSPEQQQRWMHVQRMRAAEEAAARQGHARPAPGQMPMPPGMRPPPPPHHFAPPHPRDGGPRVMQDGTPGRDKAKKEKETKRKVASWIAGRPSKSSSKKSVLYLSQPSHRM